MSFLHSALLPQAAQVLAVVSPQICPAGQSVSAWQLPGEQAPARQMWFGP